VEAISDEKFPSLQLGGKTVEGASTGTLARRDSRLSTSCIENSGIFNRHMNMYSCAFTL
jgi:hypothetical protein